jgi:hypothetical protein
MAEIKIQPKQHGAKWWMWLLPLLLLGLLAWFLMRSRADEQTASAGDTTATSTALGTGAMAAPGMAGTTTATSGGAVGATDAGASTTEFATFIAATDANRDESGQHQYTSEGIRRLASAIEGSRVGANAGPQLLIMRAMADSLQQSPSGSDRHSEMTRGAFDAAIIPLASLGGNASSQLQSAARAVSPDRHLLAQKAEIQRFFETARDALQSGGAATTP